ncbi:MAG: helix-turn-helix domain-containing protein [Thermodesulfobacteriota bacterium]
MSNSNGVPEDAYKTVSAFANTAGGWLIFGIKEGKGTVSVSGVEEVDKIQNDFLSCLRAGGKVSRSIDTRGDLHEIDGKVVLAFYIPELSRKEKPAYLKGDPRESYIRRGGCDERCTQKELERFLRDAAEEPYDSQVIEGLDPESFCDEKALSWYRRMFNEKQPGRHEMLDDQDFLREWNFVVEDGGKPSITRVALLLFGKSRPEECFPGRSWISRLSTNDSRTGRRIIAGQTEFFESPGSRSPVYAGGSDSRSVSSKRQ